MSTVQISDVSAKSGPLRPIGGWIWWLFPETQSIYVIADYKVGKGGPINIGLYLYVTPETQIIIGDEPGNFDDLEEGQYITFSYYVDDGLFYAIWITVKPSGPVICPPGREPCFTCGFPEC